MHRVRHRQDGWRHRLSLAVSVSIVAAATALHAGAARAQGPQGETTARRLLREGYELGRAGKCDQAVVKLRESLSLERQPKTLLNLARCEETLLRFNDARMHWADARELGRGENLPAIVREATQRLASLDVRIPHVKVTLAKSAPEGTRVREDGHELDPTALGEPHVVDPGEHILEVMAPGYAIRTIPFTAAPSDDLSLVAEVGAPSRPEPTAFTPPVLAASSPAHALPPPPPPASARIGKLLMYGGFGTAAAAAVVGGIAGGITLSRAPSLIQRCGTPGCPQPVFDEVSRTRTLGTVATASFIVAGAAVAAGGFGLWLSSRNTSQSAASAPAPAARIAIAPWFSTDGAGLGTAIAY
jgi:hypothetical protein